MTTEDNNAPPQPPEPEADAAGQEQLYQPHPGERQLSIRAVVAGCLIGGVVSCANIYMSSRSAGRKAAR